MTRARQQLIDLSATPYYHVISRCVRRAYLCGEDKLIGKNLNHRRQWLVDRVKLPYIYVCPNLSISITINYSINFIISASK